MNKQHLTTGLKIAVTLAAIAILGSRIDFVQVKSAIGTFPTKWIATIVGLLIVSLLTSARKWQVVLGGLGWQAPFLKLVRLFWVGLFFNTFLPGRTGGDVVRAYSLSSSDGHRTTSIASVAIDRGLNLLALIIIGATATFFSTALPDHLYTVVRAVALSSVIVMAALVLGRHSVLRLLPKRIHVLVSPVLNMHWDQRLAKAAALAFLVQIIMILINVSAAQALKLPVSTTELFIAIPLTAIVTTLPISINGFGIREAAYATALSYFGTSVEQGVALSLVMTATLVGWSLIGGLVYLGSELRVDSRPISADARRNLHGTAI